MYSFSDSLSFCYYKIVNVVPCVIQSVLVILFFDNSHPNAIFNGIDGGNRVPKYDRSLQHSIFLCLFIFSYHRSTVYYYSHTTVYSLLIIHSFHSLSQVSFLPSQAHCQVL